jgi:DNA-binding GntR family transcriptional regulator
VGQNAKWRARLISALDEAFHCRLVEAARNREMVRVHMDVTEKIRVIRRLDFLKEKRIDATYDEHARLLKLILSHREPEASILLRAHIAQSKLEVRKITIHMLHEARESARSLEAPAKAGARKQRTTKPDQVTA